MFSEEQKQEIESLGHFAHHLNKFKNEVEAKQKVYRHRGYQQDHKCLLKVLLSIYHDFVYNLSTKYIKAQDEVEQVLEVARSLLDFPKPHTYEEKLGFHLKMLDKGSKLANYYAIGLVILAYKAEVYLMENSTPCRHSCWEGVYE